MARRFSEIKNREIHELHNDNVYDSSRLTEEEQRMLAEDLEKNPPSLESTEGLENKNQEKDATLSYVDFVSLSEANVNILSDFSHFSGYINAADEVKRGYCGEYSGTIKNRQFEQSIALHDKEVQLLFDTMQHNPENLESVKLDIAGRTLNDYLKFHENRLTYAVKNGSSEKSCFIQLDRNLDIPIDGKLVHCPAGSYIDITDKTDDNKNINVVSINDFVKNYHDVSYSIDSVIMRDVTSRNIHFGLFDEGYDASQCNEILEQCAVKSNVAIDLALAIDKRFKTMDIPMAIYPSNSSGQNELVIVELDREGSIRQKLDTLPIEKSLDDVKAKEFLGIIRDLSEDKNNPHQNLYKTAFEACAYNIPLMENLDKIEREYRFEAMNKKQFDLFKNGNGIPAYGKDKDKEKEPKSLKPPVKKTSLDISDRGI